MECDCVTTGGDLSSGGRIFYYGGLMNCLSSGSWEEGRVCNFAAWKYTSLEAAAEHTHDFHELFWVTAAGKGWHVTDGQRRPMAEGYLVLVRADDWHSFAAASAEGVRFFNFAFRPEIWQALRRRHPAAAGRFFDMPEMAEREYWLGPWGIERLRVMAADLGAGHCDKLTAEGFLQGVIAMLSNVSAAADSARGAPSWLEDALHRIRQYPEFAGGVPRLVKLAGRSHEHVTRECRRHLGAAPREIVLGARLRWAAAQVSATEKKIIEIALECGFQNLGRFYEVFRREHGMTPREYRIRMNPVAELRG
jgi:AraC family transcriptional regulator, dual regulator of chb operon